MASLNLKPKNVLIRPHATDKAALKVEQGVYVFEVEQKATKKSVSDSVRELYKVTPEKVRILNIPKKSVFIRGKFGSKGGGRKAYVYLKKGESIKLA